MKKEFFGVAGVGCFGILLVAGLNLAFWGTLIYVVFYLFNKFFM